MPERRREDLRELGLADPGLALEQERAAELERQEDRRRERAIGDVVAASEVVLDRLDGAGALGAGRAVGSIGHRRNLHAPSSNVLNACREPHPRSRSGAGSHARLTTRNF